MVMLTKIWTQVNHFIMSGGPVLWTILIVLLLMWILIVERWIYLRFAFKPQQQRLFERWQLRDQPSRYYSVVIRQRWLAQIELDLNRHLIFIRTLVILCPMLGLLGTVTGMISVFEALAAANRFNAEVMAEGISKATIPTMAGMVVALPGVLVISRLERLAKRALATTSYGLSKPIDNSEKRQ